MMSINATADDDALEFLEQAQRAVDLSFQSSVVLPGDDVTEQLTRITKRVKLGAGLYQQPSGQILATLTGVLRYRPTNRFWVDYKHKRYVAALDDSVIGIITDRNADFYRVNIGASSAATLDALAFDGATKRNRPSLNIGSLVYARISKLTKHVEPELTCEAPPNVTKKDWMTGLSIYGELQGGLVIKVSIDTTKDLLQPECHILGRLGTVYPFEIAIGNNGMVWVNSKSTTSTTIICNAILNSEALTSNSQVDAMIDQLAQQASIADL